MRSRLIALAAAALIVLEREQPLRRRVDPGVRRLARNVAMAAITALVIAALERPLVRRALRRAATQSTGIVPRLGLPPEAEVVATLVLLDYTLYWWHILLHRVPLLWRFHVAHHIDLDLDTSTAVRFHCGEFLLSIPWRLAQVRLIGATPGALKLWQQLTLAEVLFHHSNWRLPARLERALGRVLMTPRLHGIHHSRVASERDSNFSSGLTLWDDLHRTACRGVPQQAITIGVPPYDELSEVTLDKTLAAPLEATATSTTATRSRACAA
jgi:sterol desaturase/sphingolipid hydroxylase (fatty acid hydroxylase superfamily)